MQLRTEMASDRFNQYSVQGFNLDAARAGTASDCVIRFLAANSTVSPATAGYIAVGETAADGTVVGITRRGKYCAWMSLPWAPHADTTVTQAISKNPTAAQLIADPVYNAAFANGVLPGSLVRTVNPAAAAVTLSQSSVAYFDVTEAEAHSTTLVAGVAGAHIKFLAGDANATPSANAYGTTAMASWGVRYLGESHAF